MAKIVYQRVKDAVKELNEAGLLEKPIKLVAVKKEVVIKAFMDGVLEVDANGKTEDLPELCFDVYNELVEAVSEDEPKEEPKEEPKKEKAKGKAKAEPKPKAEVKPKPKDEKLDVFSDPEDPRFPHVQRLLKKGVTIEEIKVREFIGEALLKNPKLGVPELTAMLGNAKMKADDITVMDTWSKCLYLMNF